jgi:hypothetical protein
MSCRIERLVKGDFVVLRVSGRIQAEHVNMVSDLLGREKGRVAIDLKEVILVSHEAVDLLALSEVNGIELRNCTSYIREWVDRSRKNTGSQSTRLSNRQQTERDKQRGLDSKKKR